MQLPTKASKPIRTPEAKRMLVVVWIFCMSFAFDFRADVSGGGTGGSAAQALYVLMAIGGFGLAMILGYRHLLVRPGVFMLILWWGFIGYSLVNVTLQGVELSRFARVILPMGLCAMGITVAHIASCEGLRARDIIAPLLLAACINVVWRIFYGFAFKGVTIDTARVEVLSPALNWLFAFIGCSLMFRKKLHAVTIIATVLALGGVFISVTRALVFPMMASALMCGICLLLCLRWRILPFSWIPKKMIPFAGVIAAMLGLIVVVSFVQPTMLERWTNRLFHQGDGQTSKGLSWLTREAEARAIVDILNKEKITYIYGKGVGGSYYWDPSYYPELYLIYPDDYDFSTEIWYAGHSVWTYALFSGGSIGVLFFLTLLIGTMAFSLRGVYLNREAPGFDLYLGFLPFVAAWCLISESATSNPFDERFMGLAFGVMAGLSQTLFNRANHLRNLPQVQAPQYEQLAPQNFAPYNTPALPPQTTANIPPTVEEPAQVPHAHTSRQG